MQIKFKDPVLTPPAPKKKELHEMTRQEARVAIAQDVIKQLDANAIIAQNGIYAMTISDRLANGWSLTFGEKERLVQAQKTGAKCAVCALGSLFVCGLGDPDAPGKNGRYIEGHDTQKGMRQALAPYFDVEDLGLIESAFERSDFCGDDENMNVDRDTLYDAIQFRENHNLGDDSDALRAIMQNIVDNGGDFIP